MSEWVGDQNEMVVSLFVYTFSQLHVDDREALMYVTCCFIIVHTSGFCIDMFNMCDYCWVVATNEALIFLCFCNALINYSIKVLHMTRAHLTLNYTSMVCGGPKTACPSVCDWRCLWVAYWPGPLSVSGLSACRPVSLLSLQTGYTLRDKGSSKRKKNAASIWFSFKTGLPPPRNFEKLLTLFFFQS